MIQLHPPAVSRTSQVHSTACNRVRIPCRIDGQAIMIRGRPGKYFTVKSGNISLFVNKIYSPVISDPITGIRQADQSANSNKFKKRT